MKKLAVIAVCLLFAAPALAQSVGEKSGVNSLLGLSPSTADFVKEAAVSDMLMVDTNARCRSFRPVSKRPSGLSLDVAILPATQRDAPREA